MPENNDLLAHEIRQRMEGIQSVTEDLLRLTDVQATEVDAFMDVLSGVVDIDNRPEALVAFRALYNQYRSSLGVRSKRIEAYDLREQIMIGNVVGATPSDKPHSILDALNMYGRVSPESAELKVEGIRFLHSGLQKLFERTKNYHHKIK